MYSLRLAFVLALLAIVVSSMPLDSAGSDGVEAPPGAADTEDGPLRLLTLLNGS